MPTLNENLITEIINGDLDEVKQLLKDGADVDAKDIAEFSAIYLAFKHGHRAVAKYLYRRGADFTVLLSDFAKDHNLD